MNADTEIIEVEPTMRLGILPARTPHDVIVQATSIAKELAVIVKQNHLSRQIQGREYVYVDGWSTMGAMLGVLPREVTELTRRFDDGSYEATVELIRINDGAIIGRASAFVGMDEKDRSGKLTWGSRPEYARRSMAVTRATGKAFRLGFSWIMGLAGYAPTPAEEMEGIDSETTQSTKHTSAPSAEVQSDEPPSATMDYETAKLVSTSDGKLYGAMDAKQLSAITKSINDALKKNGLTPEQIENYKYKLDAAKVCLANMK